MADRSDAELVNQIRGGDPESYSTLVARYQGHVYGLAYSLVNNWADAQDIAQETFIRAYVNLDQLKDPARFAPWLRRVTFGVAMNWLRAYRPAFYQQIESQVDLEGLEVPDFAPGPQEVVERKELAEAVQRAIQSLPPKYRVPLTMFHLDGLSFQKVADFLDIPLGTAKSLLHRARGKLRVALGAYYSEEVLPTVQEVFDEHKLPPEFASQVLQNIPELQWAKGECAFAGAVVACLESLGQPVTYVFVMGASTAAFRLLWDPRWRPSNSDLAVMGEEPVRRSFEALGYEYEFVSCEGHATGGDVLRAQIMRSIQRGRPVIAEGGIGPPVCCVVAGYEQDGSVLLARTFFSNSRGYERNPDWHGQCSRLVLIGERTPPLARREVLRQALRRAIELAYTREINGRISGLAAYDAWADALLRDDDFPAGNLDILTQRCHVSNSIVLPGLWDARRAASAFLESMTDVDRVAASHLRAAARAYREEFDLLDIAMKMVPFCHDAETKRLQMADPPLRRELASLLLQAKNRDEEAAGCLRQALQGISRSGSPD